MLGAVAEVPLLVVRPELRGARLGAVLLGALEAALAKSGVRLLIMPALPPPDPAGHAQGGQPGSQLGVLGLGSGSAGSPGANPGHGARATRAELAAAGARLPRWWGLAQGFRVAGAAQLEALAALPVLQFPGTPLLAKALSPETPSKIVHPARLAVPPGVGAAALARARLIAPAPRGSGMGPMSDVPDAAAGRRAAAQSAAPQPVTATGAAEVGGGSGVVLGLQDPAQGPGAAGSVDGSARGGLAGELAAAEPAGGASADGTLLEQHVQLARRAPRPLPGVGLRAGAAAGCADAAGGGKPSLDTGGKAVSVPGGEHLETGASLKADQSVEGQPGSPPNPYPGPDPPASEEAGQGTTRPVALMPARVKVPRRGGFSGGA